MQFTQYITRRHLWSHTSCHGHVPRWIAATSTASTSSVRDFVSTANHIEVKRPPRVVVAMSGGVDSSVAAHLLLQQQQTRQENDIISKAKDKGAGKDSDASYTNGVDVIGLHMSNWNALDEDSSSDGPPSTKDGKQTKPRRRQRQQSSASNARADNPSNSTFCEASEQEYNDAKSVADHLSIPLHRVSFASEYWIQVFEPFVESIASSPSPNGTNTQHQQDRSCTTPNPDFGCNTYIKFGAMKEYAMDRLKADYVATGHYARVWHRDLNTQRHTSEDSNFYEWMKEACSVLEQSVRESIAGRPEEEWILDNSLDQPSKAKQYPMLIAGADKSKDQTYFLSGVKSEAFCNVLFPLGHLTKSQTQTGAANGEQHDECNNYHQQSVRDIAANANIPTASKRDSMGICFIGKRNFGNFVSQYLPEPAPPGNFVDVDSGEIVGRHEGAIYYTIGQGAKISGATTRYFVCGKGGDAGDTSSTVFVCNSTHHPALYTDELYVDFDAFNWIGLGQNKVNDVGDYHSIPRPLLEEGTSIELLARTRHLQPLASCRVAWDRSNDGRGQLVVRFDKPMRAITPGQIVSFYAGNDGLICLGGGPITSKGASFMDRGVDVSLSSLHPSGHNDLSLRQ